MQMHSKLRSLAVAALIGIIGVSCSENSPNLPNVVSSSDVDAESTTLITSRRRCQGLVIKGRQPNIDCAEVTGIPANQLSIRTITGTVLEGETATVEVTLLRAEGNTDDVEVDFTTVDGSAIDGVFDRPNTLTADYTPVTGTLTFSGDVTTQTIDIVTLEDLDSNLSVSGVAPNEDFFVQISAPINADILDDTTAVIIRDNPVFATPLPTTIPSPGSTPTPGTPPGPANIIGLRSLGPVVEGQAAQFEVTLQRVAGNTDPVSVRFRLEDGTGTAPADFAAAENIVEFAADQTTQIIEVPILVDGLKEPDEQFNLRLFDPTNAFIVSDLAIGTILDAEPVPFVIVEDAEITEGGVLEFPVSLSGPVSETVTVAFTIDRRPQFTTAVSFEDSPNFADYFAPVSLSVVFAPGETDGQSFLIATRPDGVRDPVKVFAASSQFPGLDLDVDPVTLLPQFIPIPDGDHIRIFVSSVQSVSNLFGTFAPPADQEADAIGTILEDEPIPQIVVNNQAFPEDVGEAEINVRFEPPTNEPIPVSFQTVELGDTGPPPSSIVQLDQTVTQFTSGLLTFQISVEIPTIELDSPALPTPSFTVPGIPTDVPCFRIPDALQIGVENFSGFNCSTTFGASTAIFDSIDFTGLEVDSNDCVIVHQAATNPTQLSTQFATSEACAGLGGPVPAIAGVDFNAVSESTTISIPPRPDVLSGFTIPVEIVSGDDNNDKVFLIRVSSNDAALATPAAPDFVEATITIRNVAMME